MVKLLDSTVLVDFLRGRPAMNRVLTLRRRGVEVCTTAINVEEILRGLRSERERQAADDLFSGMPVLSVSAETAWQAGTWRREFAERGHTLYQADCLIAASAIEVGAELATGNPKDFPMLGAAIEHWPVGS